MKRRIRRLIVQVRYYTTRFNRPGEGSVCLTLECGHDTRRKQSQYKLGQRKADCHFCDVDIETEAK